NAAAAGFDIDGVQGAQLIGEDGFQTAGTGGEELGHSFRLAAVKQARFCETAARHLFGRHLPDLLASGEQSPRVFFQQITVLHQAAACAFERLTVRLVVDSVPQWSRADRRSSCARPWSSATEYTSRADSPACFPR